MLHRFIAGHLLQKHAELVATNAAHHRRRRQRTQHGLRGSPQGFVTERVPASVVHALEVVEVHDAQSKRVLLCLSSAAVVGERIIEYIAIRQRGHAVNARSADNVRANTILFLALLDVVIIAYLILQNRVDAPTVWLGVSLCVPSFITSMVGQRLFDPAREVPYRRAAYSVIALAVLTGLPLFD